MSIIKCKMCGGDLRLFSDSAVAECEYCGTRQTVPTQDNEKKLHLFARANRLRFGCEFDKAAGIYEAIVVEFPSEAEAYWGLVLCKYGIEYVDDPGTGKKIPTCHRSSFESVLEDDNFDQAMENADTEAFQIYRKEAKQIEVLRRNILAVSVNEKPYDIFLCYKETDFQGMRTTDSLLAQEIYDALTSSGYRVFFSRVTLEDKLGQAYEPYIFAALQSAKLMLVVGTSKEHFNAVWVKNEWSRFLKLMLQDKGKRLIPCYKDIDAYDIPQEFAHLQGQDLGKADAIQDLLQSIAKLLDGWQKMAFVKESVISERSGANAAPLLRRAFLFLEDGNWALADEYCEKVLDQEPENALAYVGKLMVQLQVRKREELQDQPMPFDGEINYQKAIRFADNALAEELMSYIRYIRQHSEKANTFRKRKKIAVAIVAFMILCIGIPMSIRFKPKEAAEVPSVTEHTRMPQFLPEATETPFSEEQAYQEAEQLLASGENAKAAIAFGKLGDYADARDRSMALWDAGREYNTIAMGFDYVGAQSHIIGLRTNGTVISTGSNGYGQRNVSKWQDVVAVAATGYYSVGLRSDGRVLITGRYSSVAQSGRNIAEEVSQWTDIKAIRVCGDGFCGIKETGTLEYAHPLSRWQYDLSDWTNIVEISTPKNTPTHIVGLKADGTVVARGDNRYGQCNTKEWTDIVRIAANDRYTVGYRADGSVVIAGEYSEIEAASLKRTDIVDVCDVLVLHTDGTVSLTDSDAFYYIRRNSKEEKKWADVVSGWSGIRKLYVPDVFSHQNGYVYALREDGSVFVAGMDTNGNTNGSVWTDIAAIEMGWCTVGIKTDGTLVVAEYLDVAAEKWTDIKIPN